MFESQLAAFKGGEKCVRIIGHRGARGIMPENTILGFEWTLRMGVEALEFDVMTTKDGVPVIVHDLHLNAATARNNDGTWLQTPEPRIADLTYDELAQFDVGGLNADTPYGLRFPEQAFLNQLRVPRLRDLLTLVRRPEFAHVRLMLEIKSDPYVENRRLRQIQTVDAVVAEIREYAMQERTMLHSFDWDLLSVCQAQAPEMPTSYLSHLPVEGAEVGEETMAAFSNHVASLPSIPHAVSDAGGFVWAPYFADIKPHEIEEARDRKLIVATWTVNEPKDIVAMLDLGVDAIVTDYPARVQRELASRGYSWLDHTTPILPLATRAL
jgi:glycerophosphoryl diester phosphodiesterase